jgi:ERCC4-type nuclease
VIDFYRYTDKELQALLKSITIVIDSREQDSGHLTKWFDEKKIPFVSQKLDYGDYSCYLPAAPELGIIRDLYFDCFVERKASLEEVSGNLCEDRTRFESEFLRAKGNRLILMVEEQAGLEKIIEHKYDTQYNEKSFLASLFSFGHRYGIDIHFVNKKYAGMFVYMQLYYFVREFLKG